MPAPLDTFRRGCSDDRVRFSVETEAAPEQVRRALTDFSHRRLQIWDRTLDPKRYELHEQGESWAVAREGSPRSPFWVVARYDWSDPAVIRWTIEDSSYGGGGNGWIRVEPRDGGGSRLRVEYDSTDARILHRPMVFLLHHGPMGRIISRSWASALDRFARSEGA